MFRPQTTLMRIFIIISLIATNIFTGFGIAHAQDTAPDTAPATEPETVPETVSEAVPTKGTIVVGAHSYTENLVLGEIITLLLEENGYAVVRNTAIPDALTLRAAMENDEIDVYVELLGYALTRYHGLPVDALPRQPGRAHELARSLDAPQGIAWLERGVFNDTFAIMVNQGLVDETGVKTLDDLAAYMNENDAPYNICVENDFYGREFDGLAAMEARYGFTFKPENVLLMDYDSVYDGLRTGECTVAEGYSTDGRISQWGFTELEDTRAFFPPNSPSPLVRQAVLDANPELTEVLNSFLPFLGNATMSQLNAMVDLGPDGQFDTGDEQTPAAAADLFLRAAGLIKPDPH